MIDLIKRAVPALLLAVSISFAVPASAEPSGDGSLYSGAEAAADAPQARKVRTASVIPGDASADAAPAVMPSFGSSGLVSEARQYLGTNPTGRRTLWCGAFMDMVLKKSGHAGGGNLAGAYARYGKRISGPQVGAIAVIGRGRGSGPSGHVGVVSGIDPNGNPIVISGNHNRTVAESVYPRSRVVAYVLPEG